MQFLVTDLELLTIFDVLRVLDQIDQLNELLKNYIFIVFVIELFLIKIKNQAIIYHYIGNTWKFS